MVELQPAVQLEPDTEDLAHRVDTEATEARAELALKLLLRPRPSRLHPAGSRKKASR